MRFSPAPAPRGRFAKSLEKADRLRSVGAE
jgi:hypothetical protein